MTQLLQLGLCLIFKKTILDTEFKGDWLWALQPFTSRSPSSIPSQVVALHSILCEQSIWEIYTFILLVTCVMTNFGFFFKYVHNPKGFGMWVMGADFSLWTNHRLFTMTVALSISYSRGLIKMHSSVSFGFIGWHPYCKELSTDLLTLLVKIYVHECPQGSPAVFFCRQNFMQTSVGEKCLMKNRNKIWRDVWNLFTLVFWNAIFELFP